MFPICHTHVLALRSHYFKSVLCVFCDILSPKVVYTVLCPFFRPKMFSPFERVWYHSCTLGARVLATVVGPSPNGPQFCHMRYIRPGGVTQVDHESSQLSRLKAVVVVSSQSLHLCSDQWRAPQLTLKYPCNPPPPPKGGRPSLGDPPPPPRGETVVHYGGRFQEEGGYFRLADSGGRSTPSR